MAEPKSKDFINKLIILGILTLVSLVAFVVGGLHFYSFNTSVAYEGAYEAQKLEIEAVLDRTKKDLMANHQITKEYAEDFIKVEIARAQGRTGGGLVKVSTEASASGMTPQLHQAMMNTISGNLAEYQRAQSKLADIWQQQYTFCTSYPARIFVLNRIKPKPVMISSSSTKTAVETGVQEDNLLK
jgi:hypothetical protein